MGVRGCGRPRDHAHSHSSGGGQVPWRPGVWAGASQCVWSGLGDAGGLLGQRSLALWRACACLHQLQTQKGFFWGAVAKPLSRGWDRAGRWLISWWKVAVMGSFCATLVPRF